MGLSELQKNFGTQICDLCAFLNYLVATVRSRTKQSLIVLFSIVQSFQFWNGTGIKWVSKLRKSIMKHFVLCKPWLILTSNLMSGKGICQCQATTVICHILALLALSAYTVSSHFYSINVRIQLQMKFSHSSIIIIQKLLFNTLTKK